MQICTKLHQQNLFLHRKALSIVQTGWQFCYIMKSVQHDGEQLERMVKESGFKVGKFAILMGVGRNTPTRWFDVPHHDDSLLIRAARELKVDVTFYFPRLSAIAQPLPKEVPQNAPSSTSEPSTQYSNNAPLALLECKSQLAATQQKLIETLEQYNKLLVEHNQVLRSMARPATGGGAGGGVAHSLHSSHITP